MLEFDEVPTRALTPEPATWIQESEGQPSTPPRQLARRRERVSGETSPSARPPPSKRRAPPAVWHGLSFTAASVESREWRGYSATVSIECWFQAILRVWRRPPLHFDTMYVVSIFSGTLGKFRDMFPWNYQPIFKPLCSPNSYDFICVRKG